MPVMRIVLLLVLVGGLSVFAFSNLSPMLPLVFLGMRTPALPLATWIGIAIAAGAVTSFFLQLLSYLPRGSSSRRFEQPNGVSSRTRSARRETPESPESEPEPQIPYTSPPPPPEPPRTNAASDWEESTDKDWNFDEEPVAPKSTQQDFNRQPPPSSTNQTDYTGFEAKQDPKTTSQTGSVYSYSYRERDKKESGVGKPDVVYDANYRVIMPPYQKPPEPEEDDEDWGFEDDEDFDEGQPSPKRR